MGGHTMSLKAVRGTEDILPDKVQKWQYVEDKIKQICDRYHFKEIRTPVFEHTEVFQRGVGETTDIVQKEMYTFPDRGGRSLTLRRSEEHTSELQSRGHLVCRLLLEKKNGRSTVVFVGQLRVCLLLARYSALGGLPFLDVEPLELLDCFEVWRVDGIGSWEARRSDFT